MDGWWDCRGQRRVMEWGNEREGSFFFCFVLFWGEEVEAKLGEEAPGCEYRRAGTGGGDGRRCSWPWMQTDRQGNQRQAVTFSAAGGSKALFKGLVNAGCCWGISLAARRLITTVIQLSNPNPPHTHTHTDTHTHTHTHTQDRTLSGHLRFYTVQSRGWTEETTASAAANFTEQQTEYSTFLMCSALWSTRLFCLLRRTPSHHCPLFYCRLITNGQ